VRPPERFPAAKAAPLGDTAEEAKPS